MASSDPVSGVRMRGVILPATEGNRKREERGGEGGGVSGMVDQRAVPRLLLLTGRSMAAFERVLSEVAVYGKLNFQKL